MNDINIKAILTPISALVAGFLATKLNFLAIDPATWNTTVFTVMSLMAAGVLGFFTKTVNVINTAGAQAGTTVVTTPAIAASLPANKDVVSSDDVKLVNKA